MSIPQSSAARKAEPRLRVIHDESAPAYDGTAPTGHRTMIDDDVVEEVLHRCGLAALGLYTYLERKANRDGQCWPSIREMSEAAGCSKRYVTELINGKLVPAGFVTRQERKNQFGRTLGVIYTLPYHRKVGGEQGGEQGGEPLCQTSSPKVDTRVDTSREKKHTPSSAQKSPLTAEARARFDRWWARYPRKVSKQAAIQAWAKLDPDPELVETMIAVVDAWAASDQWTKDDGRFIPHPATWLNGRRWDDDLPQPARRAQADWSGGQVWG